MGRYDDTSDVDYTPYWSIESFMENGTREVYFGRRLRHEKKWVKRDQKNI